MSCKQKRRIFKIPTHTHGFFVSSDSSLFKYLSLFISILQPSCRRPHLIICCGVREENANNIKPQNKMKSISNKQNTNTHYDATKNKHNHKLRRVEGNSRAEKKEDEEGRVQKQHHHSKNITRTEEKKQ